MMSKRSFSWMSARLLGKGVGVLNVRGFNPMKDHIHGADNVSQPLLFFAVEGSLLESLGFLGRKLVVGFQIFKGFAKETQRIPRAPS